MKNTIPVITIDGPSGVGKSTIANIIANKLKWSLLESGKIYRLLAYLVLNKKISIFEQKIIPIIKDLDVLLNNKIKLNNKLIKCEKISKIASKLALYPKIREILLTKQRSFRLFPGLVAEGRDMGTIVFPDAKLKFFLDASLNTRVNRRLLELNKNGNCINFKKLFIKMNNRDKQDQNRLISPLCIPKNAIILNSTYMNLSQVVTIFMQYIVKHIKI